MEHDYQLLSFHTYTVPLNFQDDFAAEESTYLKRVHFPYGYACFRYLFQALRKGQLIKQESDEITKFRINLGDETLEKQALIHEIALKITGLWWRISIWRTKNTHTIGYMDRFQKMR